MVVTSSNQSTFSRWKDICFPVSKTSPQVLLVEDHELIASVHKKFLSELGCDVGVASNGAEALDMATQHYDLILLDIGLPDMSGIEIAKKLRYRFQSQCPRIVVTTALSGKDTINACLEAGVEQVFPKPMDLESLKKIVSPFPH